MSRVDRTGRVAWALLLAVNLMLVVYALVLLVAGVRPPALTFLLVCSGFLIGTLTNRPDCD